jgi:hypothetical protein
MDGQIVKLIILFILLNQIRSTLVIQFIAQWSMIMIGLWTPEGHKVHL